MLMGKRESCLLYFVCLIVIVVALPHGGFLVVGLQCAHHVIVVFADHTHLLVGYFSYWTINP